jgi:pimeloyl-ACP methyl ester carboxylesterase
MFIGGPEDAPPVILLHGAPQHAYEWRRVAPLLAERFRVVMPDLRGYGESDLSASGRYDIDILVDDLRAVVEAALSWCPRSASSAGGARIVAHDWGGPIAWVFAERFPGLVKHLVAVNAPHPAAFARELTRPRQLVRSWYIGLFQIPGVERMIERGGASFFTWMMRASSPKGVFTEEDFEVYRAALARPGRVEAVLAYYRQAFGPGLLERRRAILQSPRVRVPSTVLWGDADIALAPTHPEATRRYVEHLEVRRFVGVSHWVPEERPVEVALAVR